MVACSPHQFAHVQVTWSGARIRKKDEGMPSLTDNNHKGVLYVTFDVQFPKGELSDEDKVCSLYDVSGL